MNPHGGATIYLRQGDINDVASVDLSDASGAYAIPVGTTIAIEVRERLASAQAAGRSPATMTPTGVADGTIANRVNITFSSGDLAQPASTYELVVHLTFTGGAKWTWPTVGEVAVILRGPPGTTYC